MASGYCIGQCGLDYSTYKPKVTNNAFTLSYITKPPRFSWTCKAGFWVERSMKFHIFRHTVNCPFNFVLSHFLVFKPQTPAWALGCIDSFPFPDTLIIQGELWGHSVLFTENQVQRQLVPTLSPTTKDATEKTVASLSCILYIPCPFIKYNCFDISGCTLLPPRPSTTWHATFSC